MLKSTIWDLELISSNPYTDKNCFGGGDPVDSHERMDCLSLFRAVVNGVLTVILTKQVM